MSMRPGKTFALTAALSALNACAFRTAIPHEQPAAQEVRSLSALYRPTTDSTPPAIRRGQTYMGFPEKFNRYYTDPSWEPDRIVYVSPTGGGSGASPASPADAQEAIRDLSPGTMILFTKGVYTGCFDIDRVHGGTYDSPVVLVGERTRDDTTGVTINCCSNGRRDCFNLEGSNYVVIDGFELVGGVYGVRAIGLGFAANEHQAGVALLNSVGHGQHKDPFFSGQSDWLVLEHCTAYDVGSGDGHGVYLSNGSDWNIVRYNETFSTLSSDFQINADPAFTCVDEGIPVDSPECDAVAGSSRTGGRGASDFMLVEGNFFHHSLAQGPNFTSVRHSIISNNVFALPTRHGASFWQETSNPKLGSSNNLIAHNLFVTSVDDKPALEIIAHAIDNRVENNVFVALTIDQGIARANPRGQLLLTDASTVHSNRFTHNAWISGHTASRDAEPSYVPNDDEYRLASFAASWFARVPGVGGRPRPIDFAPGAHAPWLNKGNLIDAVRRDLAGVIRRPPVDLGPFER
jgi:hypothetical protein